MLCVVTPKSTTRAELAIRKITSSSDDFSWLYEEKSCMTLAIELARHLPRPVRFLEPRAPDDHLSPSLFHHGHLFAVPTYPHREKHWRVSGHSNNTFRVALDDFTRAEFGDFRKIYTETAQRGVVPFFERKWSVSPRTESTSAQCALPATHRVDPLPKPLQLCAPRTALDA